MHDETGHSASPGTSPLGKLPAGSMGAICDAVWMTDLEVAELIVHCSDRRAWLAFGQL
jgi:hypothetical protein